MHRWKELSLKPKQWAETSKSYLSQNKSLTNRRRIQIQDPKPSQQSTCFVSKRRCTKKCDNFHRAVLVNAMRTASAEKSQICQSSQCRMPSACLCCPPSTNSQWFRGSEERKLNTLVTLSLIQTCIWSLSVTRLLTAFIVAIMLPFPTGRTQQFWCS